MNFVTGQMNGGKELNDITWIELQYQKPSEHKEYLIQYNEFFGIEVVRGWKIVKWDGSFPITKRQIITHYTDVPDYIKNYND